MTSAGRYEERISCGSDDDEALRSIWLMPSVDTFSAGAGGEGEGLLAMFRLKYRRIELLSGWI